MPGGASLPGAVAAMKATCLERFGMRSLSRGYKHKENVWTEQQKEVTDWMREEKEKPLPDPFLWKHKCGPSHSGLIDGKPAGQNFWQCGSQTTRFWNTSSACRKADGWAQPQKVTCKFLGVGSRNARFNKYQVNLGQNDSWKTLKRDTFLFSLNLDKSCLWEGMCVDASRIPVIWTGTFGRY